MKKISDHTENDNPVMNGIFIGLYIAALVVLLVALFRRFTPALYSAFDNFVAF